MAKITMFDGEYSKSYKTVERATRAVEKFELENQVYIRDVYKEQAMRWIMTVASNDHSRVVPTCLNPKGSGIMHTVIGNGFAVTGTIG